MYLRDGDRFVVTSENFGQQRPAAWPLNLVADPRATIQVGAEVVPCQARLLDDAEADVYWPRMCEVWPAHESYERVAASGTPSSSIPSRRFRDRYCVLRAPTRSTLGSGMRRSQAGQATIEWSALLLALALPSLRSRRGREDRRLGPGGADRACAWCARSTAGARSATRSTSPTGRSSPTRCAARAQRRLRAPQRGAADRLPALPRDRLLRRSRRRARDRSLAQRAARDRLHARGGPARRRRPLYIQYWFYYPESFTAGIGRIFGEHGRASTRTTGRATRCGSRRAERRHRTRDRSRRVLQRVEHVRRLVPRLGRQPCRAAARRRGTSA